MAVTLPAMALATGVGAADFTSFRGAAAAGRAVGLPPGDGPLGLELVWKRPLGSGYSGVAVAGGRLVTLMADGERDAVIALDTTDGVELWRTDLGPTYGGHDGSHDGPISTPAIADGRVYALGPWGDFVAVDLRTGKPAWRRHLTDDLGAEKPFYGFGGSPVVVDDLVVVLAGGEGGAVVAFDRASGALAWRAAGEVEVGAQSPVVVELAGRRQLLVLASDRLLALDPADGRALWELPLEGRPGPMGAFTQSPLPIDDRSLLVKHQDGEALIVRLDGEAGAPRPEVVARGRGLARSYSPPSAGDGALFGYSARFLSAVDGASGEVLWRSRHPGDGFQLVIDDQLAVLTKTGSLHLAPAAADGWHERARLELFDELAWTPPSYADGALYLRSLGAIARVDLVRLAEAPAVAADRALPALLRPLAEALARSSDPDAEIDRFLAGREGPLIDGSEVIFLWRGPADDVAVAGDMIGMRREEPMRRLAGSDLWWWATELDRRARVGYLFFVDDEPRTDPSHDRTIRSTVLGADMNWNRGDGVEMSWLAMPEWPGHADESPTAAASGRVVDLELEARPQAADGEPVEPIAVPVRVWLPPGYDEGEQRYPAVYLLHRRIFAAGDWPAVLDRVVGRDVEPLIVVSIEGPRMRDAGGVLAEQLLPQIEARFRTVDDRRGRALVGMGWAGLPTAVTVFEHPDLFGAFAVQSMYLLDAQMAALEAAIGDATAATVPLDIYLEWGHLDLVSPHEEMNMRRSSRWAWRLFEERGWRPLGGEVWDSTDVGSWRNRTAVLLEALFDRDDRLDGLDRWRTAP